MDQYSSVPLELRSCSELDRQRSKLLVDYLHVDVGYSIKNATWIMTARNVGAFVGHGAGGELGQRVYDWKPRASQWYAALAKAIATPLLVCIFETPRSPHHHHILA